MERARYNLLSGLLSALYAMTPLIASAQVYSGSGNIHEVFAGTETESYLRYLDLTDSTSNESWSIRPFSPPQIRRFVQGLADHPWSSRVGSQEPQRIVSAGLLSPSVTARYNSQFPYGSGDAAVWAGRGLTTAIQAGLYAHAGPIELTLMPLAFSAQNVAFPLAPSEIPCGCGDPYRGGVPIDRPQRFGNRAYGRLDPGQSQLRIDAFGATAGFGTINEAWGPSVEYPFIIGNNAPGLPHFFFGSAAPFPVFVGRAHLRVIYGRLDQSAFSPVTGSKFYSSRVETGRVRFASGVVAVFQPRGVDGLEFGGARFIHSVWPRSGIPASYLKKPLQAFLKANQPGIDAQIAGTDNQVASFFARWAFRQSGLEVYGEYGRDDNSYDTRDFMQEPDHQRGYSLGLAKVFGRQPTQFNVLRAELINFELPALATTGRGEGSIYTHSPINQGHTNRGQLLGADVGVGAAGGSTVRWDHYSGSGRWAVFWRRDLRQEESDASLNAPSQQQEADVLHAFGVERVRFTRRFDLTGALTLMRDLSRNFQDSRFNANAVLGITLRP